MSAFVYGVGTSHFGRQPGVGGPALAQQAILEALGYRVAFRYQKYREEFGDASCVVAIPNEM